MIARGTTRNVGAGLRLAALLLAVAAGAGYAASERAGKMIRATDLRDEARIAREQNLVLMLEFSSEFCRCSVTSNTTTRY